MPDTRNQRGKSDYANSSLVTDLARVADEALIKGDYRRCTAIIENIYDLLERQTVCQTDRDIEAGASRGIRWLETDLTPSPFCLGIPI